MRLLGHGALWIGCTALVVAFLATEQLVSGAGTLRWPETTANTAEKSDDASADKAADVDQAATEQSASESKDADAQSTDAKTESQTKQTKQDKQDKKDTTAKATHSTQVHRVYRVTAYCDRGKTAAGVPSGVGQCAAPEDIPFGSKIYIPELDRTFIVTDRTHRRFRHNTVDIFMPNKTECREFGLNYLECVVSVIDEEPAYGKVSVTKQ